MRLKYLRPALRDIAAIEAYIGEASGLMTAIAAADGLRERCMRLATLPGTLGTDRSELRPGLRSTPHGSYIILFRYTADAVEIVNVIHAGRDVTAQFEDN